MTYVLPVSASALVLLGQQTLSAANTYTTPTFAAGLYRKVMVDFVGKVTTGAAAGTLLGLVVNADTGTNYCDLGWSQPAFLTGEGSGFGTLGYAKVGRWNIGNLANAAFKAYVEVFTEKLGYARMGFARAHSNLTTVGVEFYNDFAWSDTTSDITSLTIKTITSTDTISGKIKVWGEPA